jgi:predicted component of type VI protein secretion system
MSREIVVRVKVVEGKRGEQPATRGDDPATQEYRLTKLPISLGRTPGNDIQIVNNFVSSNHARLEEVGGKLCVRDLASRNGVQVLSGADKVQIPAEAPYELSRCGFEFYLGAVVRVRVEPPRPISVEPAPRRGSSPPAGGSAIASLPGLSGALPPLPELRRPLHDLPPIDLPPRTGLGSSESLAPAGANRSDPWGPVGGARAPVERPPPAKAGFEPVRPDHGLAPLPHAAAAAPGFQTGNFDLSPEALALQGLRELAGSLLPGRTLETRGDVARLIGKLHNNLEVLCRTFLALRTGYAQFVSSMHLQRSAQYSQVQWALDKAKDPASVASLLLDYREGAPDASPALEASLGEIGLHQRAMVEGFMEGIRALLDELSPENITTEVEGKRGRLRVGRSEKSLWEEYRARHERFSDEGEAFSRVFGEEFAEAYRHYRRSRGPR